MLKRVQHDDCILMRTSVPGDGDVKTKVARQRNVAAKAALRRVRVLIGTPVRVGAAGVAPDGMETGALGGRGLTLLVQCGYAAMHNPRMDLDRSRRCLRSS